MRRIDDRRVEVDFVASQVPPLSARQYHICPAPVAEPVEQLTTPVIENARFRIQAGENGLVSIFDKLLDREILSTNQYHPGELILEHDEGSPWATLSADQHRIPLAPYTCLVRAEKTDAYQRLTFSIETPREMGLSGKCLRARLSVALIEGLDQVNFNLHADWDSFNHRLRVAMPVPSAHPGRHVYEIPYGMVTRTPYQADFGWTGANGDWPAINWAGVEYPGMSVALFNQGTPSYRIEPGAPRPGDTILLSLLRSPAIPTYLHEPEFYTMTDWDGMRDSGEHDFAYAIRAYACPFADCSVVQDAEAYNIRPVFVDGTLDLPAMPAVQSAVARLAAIKWAEAGDGLILRLVEYRGQGGEAEISLPFAVRQASKVNLLERQAERLEIQRDAVRCYLRPWEIATLKLAL
jgi:hypothetical protein